MAFGPITSWQIDGETVEIVTDFIFWGSKITADGDCSHEIKRHLLLGRRAMTSLDSTLKNRGPSSQSYGVSSSPVWMWDLDYKESLTLKNWCFWTVVLKKTLESLELRSIQSILKEISLNIHWKDWCWSWHSNSLATWCEDWLLWKDPDAGKDWRRQEKGTTEDEMVGWHHWLNGHEFE